MKHTDKTIFSRLKAETKSISEMFLSKKCYVLLSGVLILGFLLISLILTKDTAVFPLYIANCLLYLSAVKLLDKDSKDIMIYILVFGFLFRFSVSVIDILSYNPLDASGGLGIYKEEYQVFKDISAYLGGDIIKLLGIRALVFLFEFGLISILFKIYKRRKHFFLHYFWNIPVIYEFYYKPNLIVVFLFFFFFALHLAMKKKRFLSSLSLGVSFFFNFGVFPFFSFFYKRLKWWLFFTCILSIAFVFFAGYFKILFSYMTTFQEVERGFFSILALLRYILPFPQLVLIIYYSLIISLVIYYLIKEIHIFDSIYAFLLALILINPNKEISFISFLLTFTVIFPNMGIVYFSLFLFIRVFLAKTFLDKWQLEVLNILAVTVLYVYHTRIFFQWLNALYKRILSVYKK
jgi:hypothetical protein